MANGASRIFKVMQNSGTDTVSELVHLKVKTINPLTFTLDDRVTLTEDFVELNSNINKSNLKIDDVLTAFSLNGGQLFFIQQYFSENPISRELPAGGNQGQILSKKSNEDYDTQWIDNNGGITVVDNLNSDSTTDALSAKQGKELNQKIDTKIVTNTEIATNEYIDGKRVYIKQLEFTDTFDSASPLTKAHGIVGATKVWIDSGNSYIIQNNACYPLPLNCFMGNFDNQIGLSVNLTELYIHSQTGWNDAWKKVVRLKYIK